MTAKVLGISNAIVDILAHVDEAFLTAIGAPKKSMVLIDAQRAQDIYSRMGPATEKSGGSVANTIAGLANLGARTAYIGRVADDQLGQIFVHDMRSLGVDVRLDPVRGGAPTARSYILITPDGERTMQTYLGAAAELGPENVTSDTFGRPEVLLLEGYLWDLPPGQGAMAIALALAKQTGARVALSLSDSWCVDRHHAQFAALIGRDVKIVFANETEILRLFEEKDSDAAVERAARIDALFVITRSEKGSVIVQGREKIVQRAYPVAKVVDATGAGDAYVAGFLYGMTRGKTLSQCADLGSRAATLVIQQVGPRLEPGALKAE
ncbi:MAG: adenosine kinase [Gammaproteobacteria bacterium]